MSKKTAFVSSLIIGFSFLGPTHAQADTVNNSNSPTKVTQVLDTVATEKHGTKDVKFKVSPEKGTSNADMSLTDGVFVKKPMGQLI